MTMYLRRQASFSAGFRQPPPGETGRGHDYLVEMTVGGPINAETGMVVNIKDIDVVLKAQLAPLHGSLLDECPALNGRVPTPENLAAYLWEQCCAALTGQSRLARLALWPTPLLKAELSQKPPTEHPMLTMTRTYDFSASHRLHSAALTDAENADIFGKCNWQNGHGHNYEVEVTLAGAPDPRTGQLWDGACLDKIVTEEVLAPYDHKYLNCDVPDFQALNPTSENLTQVIWRNLARRLAHEDLGGARLFRVAVRETARNSFEYYGEE